MNTVVFLLMFISLGTSAIGQAGEYKIKDYQYGSKWSRRLIQKQDLSDLSIKKAIRSSIAINGGSGVYLGKYNGHHLIATTFHGIRYPGCDMMALTYFRAFGSYEAGLSGCLATFPDLDLAILSFSVDSQADEVRLKPLAANFAFNEIPKENERLVFVGHGIAGNPKQKQMLGADKDCRVVSKSGDVRFLDDPDKINPNGYATWQIANACDISHGDSGAGLFGKISGKLLALVSSGTFPVKKKFQTSPSLTEELQKNPELAWQMNLAVPAFKIREIILQRISEGEFDPDTVATLRALLENRVD